MKKYLAYMRMNIQNAFAYRGPLIIWLGSNLLTLTIFVSLWLSANMTGSDIGGYSKNQLVTYYLYGLLLQWIVGWFPFYWLRTEIKSGDIAGSTLSKPVRFYWKNFFIELGWHIVSVWPGLLAMLIMGKILGPYFVFYMTPVQALTAILAVIIAIFITFTTSVCMALTAFWLTHVDTLDGFFWAGRSVFGGEGIPIALFPVGLITLIKYLPFRYMYSFPLEVALGKLSWSEMTFGFIMGLSWTLILVVIYKYMWAKGTKFYTSAGV